jgi:hypothetical protein
VLESGRRPSPIATADIRFAMARLHAATEPGHTKARTLADEARADYQAAGDRGRSGLTRLAQWRTRTLDAATSPTQ